MGDDGRSDGGAGSGGAGAAPRGAPALSLHNTLTRRKEPFVPIDPANVRLYACGPTVYDRAHIGNARPLIVFDVLFRLLRHLYGPEHVTYARNVTDVDDRINARAAERGITIRELTDGTLAGFREDAAALRCLGPADAPGRMTEPRATDHIPEMVALIDRLVRRGHAYVAEGHVLFEVASTGAYGALSKRPPEALLAGARVEVAPYKRSPLDFVLWKPSGPGEPAWPSPEGVAAPGRPGWHIECSAMSMKALLEPWGGGLACDDPGKNTFDIHAGGLDLIFPHHENEIAQSCCALGTDAMANVWLHNGFLQVEGRKMSKSEGNFVTIREVLTDWPGEVARWAMLKTHYRQPIDWTRKSLDDAKRELCEYAWFIEREGGPEIIDMLANDAPYITTPFPSVVEAICDDLNTPLAISRLKAEMNTASKAHMLPRGHAVVRLMKTLEWLGVLRRERLHVFDSVFLLRGNLPVSFEGLDAANKLRAALANDDEVALIISREKLSSLYAGAKVDLANSGELKLHGAGSDVAPARFDALAQARRKARAARDFSAADRLRDEAAALGARLIDHKDGTTTWEPLSARKPAG